MMKVTSSRPRKVSSRVVTRLSSVRNGAGRDRLLKPVPALDCMSIWLVTKDETCLRTDLFLRNFVVEGVVERRSHDEDIGFPEDRRHPVLMVTSDQGLDQNSPCTERRFD